MIYSADRLVFAASILCRSLGVPSLIIDMTVVSIGISLPEIITSVAASAAWSARSCYRHCDRIKYH